MKTAKPKIADFNSQTGESIVRDMTDAEFAQHKIDLAAMTLESEKFDAKITAKASAIAKLEALGLNLEEAQAIFG
jgi:hypothetical protein